MGVRQRLKSKPWVYGSLLAILNKVNYFTLKFNLTFPFYKLDPIWGKRIEIVMGSPDNLRIDTVESAGAIMPKYQVMHNGLKIHLGSYYSKGNAILLRENKGIHEPQEEFVFQEVLKTLPPAAKMMELGSYWAFYSMWFCQRIKFPNCYMVEPDPYKMNFGKLNFALNKFKGTFIEGFISSELNLQEALPIFTVDYLMKYRNIGFLDILHSDIQGYEFNMLLGAEKSLRQQKFGYIFISTHSNDLHAQCIKKLLEFDYQIICEANLDESFSWDGLIVAKSKSYAGLEKINISKRNT